MGWQGPCPSNLIITLGSQLPILLLLPDQENLMGEIRKDFHSLLLLVLGESRVVSHHVLATCFSALCSFLLFA